ncbi:hypothetical protein EBY67_07550, partial [bacterium]|nr:hypothetical protein [bacterium]
MLHNSADVIRWNTNKEYLTELVDAEIGIVPTTFVHSAEELVTITNEGMLERDIVVKPTISAGSNNTERHEESPVKAAAHLGFLLDAGFVAMVQPYQRFIDERGETGMVYFNGQLSHSFRKGAILATGENVKNGLFTVEEIAPRTASGQERELGKAVGGWRDRVRTVYDSIFAEIRPTTVAFVGSTFPSSIVWQDKVVAEAAWSSLAPSGEVHATARTRENFQRMRPLLEKQLEGCARPDLALGEFANFTQGYGARSLLYESLCVSPQALELLIRFFESSRALGPRLVAHPELFEEVVQAGLDGARTLAWHRAALKIEKKDGDEAMGGASIYTRGEELRIALRGLLGLAPIPILQGELTAL